MLTSNDIAVRDALMRTHLAFEDPKHWTQRRYERHNLFGGTSRCLVGEVRYQLLWAGTLVGGGTPYPVLCDETARFITRFTHTYPESFNDHHSLPVVQALLRACIDRLNQEIRCDAAADRLVKDEPETKRMVKPKRMIKPKLTPDKVEARAPTGIKALVMSVLALI